MQWNFQLCCIFIFLRLVKLELTLRELSMSITFPITLGNDIFTLRIFPILFLALLTVLSRTRNHFGASGNFEYVIRSIELTSETRFFSLGCSLFFFFFFLVSSSAWDIHSYWEQQVITFPFYHRLTSSSSSSICVTLDFLKTECWQSHQKNSFIQNNPPKNISDELVEIE